MSRRGFAHRHEKEGLRPSSLTDVSETPLTSGTRQERSDLRSPHQQPKQTKAPHPPLSSRAKPRDLRFPSSATKVNRSTPPSFVIPSEAEGSAVLLISNENQPKRPTLLCHPERSRGICSSPHQQRKSTKAPHSPLSSRAKPRDLRFPSSATKVNRRTPLSFVIPSEAEGSAVLLISNQNQPKPPHSPLSSRAKPRDLRFPSSATKVNRSTPLSFVIPSEAEGSAVLLISNENQPKNHTLLCHPERSRGICGSLHQQRQSTEAPHPPLSSRSEAEGSAVSFISNENQPKHPTPFVIPSAAEGSAVPVISNQSQPKPPHPLCHLDRSEAEWRDLQSP